MTDLFDRVAARAFGHGLALRPRIHSRFEPETDPPTFATPDLEWPQGAQMPPSGLSARLPDRVRSRSQANLSSLSADSVHPGAEPVDAQHVPLPQPDHQARAPIALREGATAPPSSAVDARSVDEAASPHQDLGRTEIPSDSPRNPLPAAPARTAIASWPSTMVRPRSSLSALAAASADASISVALPGDIPTPTAAPANGPTRTKAPPAAPRRSASPQHPASDAKRPTPVAAERRSAPERWTPLASGNTAAAARSYGPPDSSAGGGIATTPPPVIEVTIGRLEIRGEPVAASRPAKPFQPHLDLAAYRTRREGRR